MNVINSIVDINIDDTSEVSRRYLANFFASEESVGLHQKVIPATHSFDKRKHVKIFEAKKRVIYWRVLAIVLMLTSALFFVCGVLNGLYAGVVGDTGPFQFISHLIQNAVIFVYERTNIIKLIYKIAPTPSLQTLNSSDNLGIVFETCCFAIGRVIWNSASHLNNRIAKTLQNAEEQVWKQDLLQQRGQLNGVKTDFLQISIELEQKDQWYKRPSGFVLLGVAVAVIAQLVNLEFGLMK